MNKHHSSNVPESSPRSAAWRTMPFLTALVVAFAAATAALPARADYTWGNAGTECRGTQRVDYARLWGLSPGGPDWVATCKKTTAHGVSKRSDGKLPSTCLKKAGNAVWGEWKYSNSASCKVALKWDNDHRTCAPWKGTVSARLWNIPGGQDWQTVCKKTPISAALKQKYGLTGEYPTRCVNTLLGIAGIWGEWDKADDAACADPRFARYPFQVSNRSGRDVFMTAMWLSDGKIVTQKAIWLKAGRTVPMNLAGPLECDLDALEAALKSGPTAPTAQAIKGISGQSRDSCLGQHFQVMFWNSEKAFAGYAAENSAVQIATYLIANFALGKLAWGVIPLPGDEEAADFAGKKWLSMRSPDGSLKQWGVHGWAINVPQQQATVYYWGPSYAQDVVLQRSHVTDLVPPASRGAVDRYVYENAVDARGRDLQRRRVCGKDC